MDRFKAEGWPPGASSVGAAAVAFLAAGLKKGCVRNSMERMKSVLEGIRVLDLSRHISGPFGGLLLADFGAEVIRIERPGGEDDRYMGLQGPSGDGFMFLNQARNKKAITLNFMENKKAFAVLMELVKKVDVFLPQLQYRGGSADGNRL